MRVAIWAMGMALHGASHGNGWDQGGTDLDSAGPTPQYVIYTRRKGKEGMGISSALLADTPLI